MGAPPSTDPAPGPVPSPRPVVLTAAGLGVLVGALGAFGWHLQPAREAIISIFGVGGGGPTAGQIEDWTDMWRPLWWPVVLGFPAAGLLSGALGGPVLGSRRVGAAVRPVWSLGALGLILGAAGAVGWHYHPFARTEPPPLLFSSRSDEDRERLIAMIQSGPFGGRVDDWADLWWPAILAYPLLATALGVAAGAALRR